MKRYANSAVIYAVLAMVCGVFYREFTKIMGFTAKTHLSVLHTHYFVPGMVFFLLLLVLEKTFSFAKPSTHKTVIFYHLGLNITAAAFLARGIFEVVGTELSSAVNASLSGIAGIGHTMLGVSMILLLLQVRKAVK